MSAASPPAQDRGAGTRHASAVAFRAGADWAGVLILGPSGSGKSTLALELMAMGARLVADDRVALSRAGPQLRAAAPPALRGLIEARGIGLLRADALPQAPIALAVDLARTETRRLPPARRIDLMGVAVPLICATGAPGLAAALRQAALGGIEADAPQESGHG